MELLQLGNMRHLQTGERLKEFCLYAESALKSSKPKILSATGEKRRILVFTDASWESGYGGLGAVTIDLATNTPVVYSERRL